MTTVISRVSASAGYLENVAIDFADGLNCIIGARGTCKSTIVETIRFVFNCDPERVRTLTERVHDPDFQTDVTSSRGLIAATLGEGTAKCTVLSKESGDSYLIERVIGSSSRVYREGIQEVGSSDVLDRVEIYSQGDLQKIAEKSTLRLQLIDRPNQSRVRELREEMGKISADLRILGPEIKRLRGELDARQNEIRGLDGYRRNLEEMQSKRPQLSPELSAQREAFQKRRELIDSLRVVGKERVDLLSNLINITRSHGQFRLMADRLGEQAPEEARVLRERLNALADFMERIKSEADRLVSEPLGPALEELSNIFRAEDERYLSLRREEQELNEGLRKEDALRQEIEKMIAIERRVQDLQGELQLQMARRSELRSALDQYADELYKLRLEQVEGINSEFSDVVLLTLRQGAESPEYRLNVNNLLQGSRIRNQEEVAADIASRILPTDLIDAVEGADAKRLSEALGRDLGQMTRLVSFLLDNPKLYQLEGLVFEDWLEITMYIDGHPKPINQLSKGQMATALLPLILRPAPYPLIFDQPEDDLDNAFIYKTLISRVRDLKCHRQMIFITHNANIPVLGDADRVIVMSMRLPEKAENPFMGGVEEAREPILALLEGGAEAFRRRQERYGDLVKGGLND